MNALTDWLIATASHATTSLLVWSWQALVLIAVAWLSLRVFRVKSSALRHQFWLVSLVALALLPLATGLSHAFPAIRPATPNLSYVAEAPRQVARLMPQREPVSEVTTQRLEPFPQTLTTVAMVESLALLFWLVWLGGASIVLIRLLSSHFGTWRARRRAELLTVAIGVGELASCRVALGLSPGIDSPLLCGFWRPAILLPADIDEWTTSDERNAMIRHELAHIERRDQFVNLFQTAMSVIFFFHPAVRYACRQMSLERELACDDHVVASGASPQTYVEGLLKVAERSLGLKPSHQLAFFSAKQILERRIEMILNHDRTRAGARHWKLMTMAVASIAIVTWLLIPAGGVEPGLARQLNQPAADKIQMVKDLGDDKAYGQLIEMALRNPDGELRSLAAVRLTELEGDGSTEALVSLYNQSSEPEVKNMMIDALARASEMEALVTVARSESNPDYRLRAIKRINWLKQTSDSKEVRAWDISSLGNEVQQKPSEPPPPPRPINEVIRSKRSSRRSANRLRHRVRYVLKRMPPPPPPPKPTLKPEG